MKERTSPASKATGTKNNGEVQVNLVDIFLYLLSYWYWFILCIGIAVGYTYYKYAKTPFTYRSAATVLIKTPSNTQSTANLTRYSTQINTVSMTNEILELKSKHLMTRVVQTLNARYRKIR